MKYCRFIVLVYSATMENLKGFYPIDSDTLYKLCYLWDGKGGGRGTRVVYNCKGKRIPREGECPHPAKMNPVVVSDVL